ncbi:MAG: SIMPL domain-containing protein [Bacteroidales bacterium]|nr:SIMPL domain-containing protein [Bacteroidales bacterium]
MKKTILLAIFFLSLISIQAQTKNFIDQPYIETSAKADTLVTPDEIYLNIIISESDTKGKISVEEMANKMEQKLKHLGIDIQKQLTLNDLSSNFKKYFLRSKDVEKTKSYTLMVHTAVMAGKVIMELEDINIGNVKLDRTAYSQPEKLKLLLRSEAAKKAYEQAVALVEPLGQRVGSAIFISDQTFNERPVVNSNVFMVRGYSSSAPKSEPLNIGFQKIKFQSEVNIKFKLLQPKQ